MLFLVSSPRVRDNCAFFSCYRTYLKIIRAMKKQARKTRHRKVGKGPFVLHRPSSGPSLQAPQEPLPTASNPQSAFGSNEGRPPCWILCPPPRIPQNADPNPPLSYPPPPIAFAPRSSPASSPEIPPSPSQTCDRRAHFQASLLRSPAPYAAVRQSDTSHIGEVYRTTNIRRPKLTGAPGLSSFLGLGSS